MKVGVIGLGAMGAPMAINLHKAGLLTAVWNRSLGRAKTLTGATCVTRAESPPELAAQCEVIILSVSADGDVMAVIEALLPGCRPGATVIDTSTVSAATAIKVGRQLKSMGVDFLDAPVSGGVEGAQNAALSMMVGGEQRVLDKARPVLQAIAGRIVHMGAVGNGQAAKAVNQIMVAGINQAVTEALAFGRTMDLPMDSVIEAVAGGAAGNWFLSHRGSAMVREKFGPGFRIALHDKDLGICEAMAKEKGMELPLVKMTRQHYRLLISGRHGDEDISALYRLKRG